MSYFKTSYATLQVLARAGRFEDVAGFLVMARHASGLAMVGYEPYTFSGAGVNSIHEKAGVSEETARGVIERLKEQGVIRAAPPDVTRAYPHARWEVLQGPLDLFLPHSFVDPLKKATATSALKRLKAATADANYRDAVKDLSDAELRLDALMLMLAIYKHTSMEAYGGLDPHCVFRRWDVKSHTAKGPGVRWGAEPEESSTARAYPDFMAEALAHCVAGKKGFTEQQKPRFWNAWSNAVHTSLLYEAVCLYDAAIDNPQARLQYTVRVNDYHAGSAQKSGDPSLLRAFENSSSNELGYYTPPVNDREEPEAMWVVLPDRRGALVGIWRPRLRASTPDAGAWIDKENGAIEATLQRLAVAVD
jgi:DNA-binding Lrp family transcriptional regulator